MNTFFFGYLSLKGRRFARVLSILSLILYMFLISMFWDELQYITGIDDKLDVDWGFSYFIFYLIFICIISYTIKPFVVKAK